MYSTRVVEEETYVTYEKLTASRSYCSDWSILWSVRVRLFLSQCVYGARIRIVHK